MNALTELHGMFVQMLEKQEQTDVVFNLVDPISNDSEVFHAHKFILTAASPVFKASFTENWSAKGEPIEINDVDANLFKMFIK